MTNPVIVFCTTCKGRVQHIEETFLQNMRDNEDYRNCKFLVLDYDSTDHLADWLYVRLFREHRGAGKAVVYSFKQPGPFQMAHAKNMAHRLGILEGADILCNLDADNLTGPGFASYLAERFTDVKEESFLWARMIQGRLPKGISGRIAVTAKQFLNSGGYDERYSTWGPDDKDFQTRLRRMGYLAREIAPQFLNAVLHNNRMRFKEYPEAQTVMGEEQFHQQIYESDTTVVNFGHFGEGIVFRNFDFARPIVLGPLPTRIFGIGMHKTATTSLNAALKILGFDAAHWQDAHWAKAIWEEMTASGRSHTLERHYALSDLPITILYERLDKAYPGSKFILTMRSEEAWIRSVRNHWDHNRNPFRSTWSTDPFTHQVHKLVYGQKGFDAEIMLARYRRHNAEVREYFKDRPNDLLEMHMDGGDERTPQGERVRYPRPPAGWPELCAFLNRPIPDRPYPRKFITQA
jgi:hypothetical protein